MKYSRTLLSIGLMAVAVAAGCASGGDECDGLNLCTTEGTTCSGNVLITCAENADGCLVATQTDCSLASQICDDSGATAVCTDDTECTDECTTVTETRCSGTVIQTCTAGLDGCNDWVSGTDCDDTAQVCDDSAEPAVCAEDECSDECATVDDTQCNGTVIETCTEGLDGCNDWVGGTDCDDTAQYCDDSAEPAVCTNSGCTELLADGSFEGGTPSSDWAEDSTQFGTPLCTEADCGGTGGGTGPHSGTWWAWFGGVEGVEVGTLSQDVTIPSGVSASLSFYLEIPSTTGNASETLVVTIDGTEVFSVTAADSASYATYQLVAIDVSSFADDGSHTLLFTATTEGTAEAVTNFFVDDVSVGSGDECCVDACTADETRCDGTVIETCTMGSACYGWVPGTDCADTDQVCNDADEPAVCETEACVNECDVLTETQCNGTVIETCTEGLDGCYDWVAGTDCNDTTQLCDDSDEPALCVDCLDECTTLTDTQCNGTVIETCTEGGDGCYDWVAGTDCADTAQVCDDTAEPAICEAAFCALTEGFEGGVLPADWATVDFNANQNWVIATDSPYTGTYNAQVEYDDALGDQDEVLLTPVITCTGASVSFWWSGSYYWGVDPYPNYDIGIWVVIGDWDAGAGDDIELTSTLMADYAATNGAFTNWTYLQSTYDLPVEVDGTPVRFAFRYVGNDGAAIYIDDVVIE